MEITINFKNIISELKSNNLKLCILRNKYLYIEDEQNNLYQMELYRIGSYLDRLIKEGVIVKFHQIEKSIKNNIKDWEKRYITYLEIENI